MKAIGILFGLVLSTVALAQQSPPVGTTEQQARSYIVSAFMTGAAPMVLADDVRVTPELRQRLGVSATANSRAVYEALIGVTGGKTLSVRTATGDEAAKSGGQAQPGKPLFALEAGETTLVLQYDLQRDAISFLGHAGGPVALASPVTQPAPPERVPDPLPAATPAPPAPAVEAPKPPPPAPVAVEAPKPVPQIVEPREPRIVKPPPSAARAVQSPPPTPAPRAQVLRPSGPCVIKPVMSDQDLVNCGATPR